MKRFLLRAVLALTIMFSVFSMSSDAASAHNVSSQSFFWCGAKRAFPNDLIIHSLPIYLDAHTVIYWCKEQGPEGGHKPMTYHVWVSLDDGSSAVSDVHDCPPPSAYWCESEPS